MPKVPTWKGFRLRPQQARVVHACSLDRRPGALHNVSFIEPERELVARMGYDPRTVTLDGLERALVLESEGAIPAAAWQDTVVRLSRRAPVTDHEPRLFRNWLDG
jgi:hypothetical protein